MCSVLPVCRRTLVCIVASVLALPLSAQSFVHRYRNTSGDLYYDAIHPLLDGRIMAGGATSANIGRAAAALFDTEGNVLWNRVYGGQPGFAWGIADCAETAGGDLLDCPAGQYLFEVYNRWGQKIFATDDPVAGWDGNCDGKASPSDVYAWVIYFGETDATGQVLNRKEKGHVTLLR